MGRKGKSSWPAKNGFCISTCKVCSAYYLSEQEDAERPGEHECEGVTYVRWVAQGMP